MSELNLDNGEQSLVLQLNPGVITPVLGSIDTVDGLAEALDALQEEVDDRPLSASVYLRQQVTTYAEALQLATGSQPKLINVTTDETDGGRNNRYYYEGIAGELDLQF